MYPTQWSLRASPCAWIQDLSKIAERQQSRMHQNMFDLLSHSSRLDRSAWSELQTSSKDNLWKESSFPTLIHHWLSVFFRLPPTHTMLQEDSLDPSLPHGMHPYCSTSQ